jgi:hypothetical protein
MKSIGSGSWGQAQRVPQRAAYHTLLEVEQLVALQDEPALLPSFPSVTCGRVSPNGCNGERTLAAFLLELALLDWSRPHVGLEALWAALEVAIEHDGQALR